MLPWGVSMGFEVSVRIGSFFFAAAALAVFLSLPARAQSPDGAALFAAAGCANCHTDAKAKGPLLGGGAGIKTPFGTFYAPNISSGPEHGIGKWSEADFIRAMREGTGPGWRHLYPAFPYTAYTNMTDDDMRAIKAHIMSLPPVGRPSREHDLKFPFNIRFGMLFWKWLFLDEGPVRPDPARSAEWNRGRYLANGVAHCAECHTPRTLLGALNRDRWMAGNAKGEGPEGEAVPNITPHPTDGIGKWTVEELAESLETGFLPNGDSYGSLMADVVEKGTAKLNEADRRAIAVYIKSLPPLPGRGSR